MTSFLKNSLGFMAAGSMVLGVVAISAVPAQAREGGAIAAGVIGGLALGAIAGSAAANSNYNNGYNGYPAYGPPPQPAYGGGCYFEPRPVYDEYGEVVGHRRVRVCE